MAKDGTKDYQTGWGTALWATLGREEVIQGKGTGKQSIKLVLTGKDLVDAQEAVEEFIGDTFPKKKAAGVARPFKTRDGAVFITASTYLYKEKGSTTVKRVPIVNAKGLVVANAPDIGNGSVVRLKITMQPTEYQGKDFVKFWLNGVQVKKLEVYAAGTTFDAADDAEGGWTGDEFDDGGTPASEASDADRDGADF